MTGFTQAIAELLKNRHQALEAGIAPAKVAEETGIEFRRLADLAGYKAPADTDRRFWKACPDCQDLGWVLRERYSEWYSKPMTVANRCHCREAKIAQQRTEIDLTQVGRIKARKPWERER